MLNTHQLTVLCQARAIEQAQHGTILNTQLTRQYSTEISCEASAAGTQSPYPVRAAERAPPQALGQSLWCLLLGALSSAHIQYIQQVISNLSDSGAFRLARSAPLACSVTTPFK